MIGLGPGILLSDSSVCNCNWMSGTEESLQMSLKQQLALNKAAICAAWFDALAATYPADTARFLKGNQDPFANPVGGNSRQSLEILLDLVLTDHDADKAKAALDVIVRIRAIQGFTPAQAVRFVFDLKTILRRHLAATAGDARVQREMADLDSRIDALALAAFDVYVGCREKIYEIKANEVRSKTFKAFARAGLIKDPSDES